MDWMHGITSASPRPLNAHATYACNSYQALRDASRGAAVRRDDDCGIDAKLLHTLLDVLSAPQQHMAITVVKGPIEYQQRGVHDRTRLDP